MPDNTKPRKRIVVEEVEVKETPKGEEIKKEEYPTPDILEEGAKVSSEELIKEEKEVPKEEKPIERETEEILPVPETTKKGISPVFWIIIPGIFLLGAILGGIVFYQKGVNNGQAETTPTAVPEISAAPSASPSATPDLSKYTIDILNGSGISGEAGKAKTLLTTAGFSIGSTGNAATYDYTKTIIKAKSNVDPAFVSALSSSLNKTYVTDTPQTLSDSSNDDVQVIIGSSKAP